MKAEPMGLSSLSAFMATPPSLCLSTISFATLFVSGSSGKHIHATMLVVKCIVGTELVLSWSEKGNQSKEKGHYLTAASEELTFLMLCENTSYKSIDRLLLKQIMLHILNIILYISVMTWFNQSLQVLSLLNVHSEEVFLLYSYSLKTVYICICILYLM